jgi:hypothetical protein
MSDVYPPGDHVPFCMGPDGGGACVGYIALYSDWLSRIRRIEALEAALQEIAHRAGNYEDVDAADWLQSIHKIAAAALAPEQDK